MMGAKEYLVAFWLAIPAAFVKGKVGGDGFLVHFLAHSSHEPLLIFSLGGFEPSITACCHHIIQAVV